MAVSPPHDSTSPSSAPLPDEADYADFFSLFDRSSQPGATPAGGLHRLSASKEDGVVRRLFCDWLSDHGFEVRIDPIGNIFGLMTLNPGAPYVMCGSHLDSQPSAGRFDGCYGVIAAAVAADIVARHFRQRGVRPAFNLCVVDWTNEEGARFQPSLTGSAVFTGALALADARALTDAHGVTLGAALTEIGFSGDAKTDFPVAAYAEIHVEQGKALETKRLAIGVVRETWAASKWRVRFDGEQNHTGPTPMADRRDALLAAAHTIVHVREEAAAHGLRMHSSVGRLDIYPNSPNVVPSRTTMMIELRSQDLALLAQAGQRLQQALERFALQTGTQLTVEAQMLRDAIALDARLSDLALTTCEAIGLAAENSVTVAGHDAVSMSAFCPSCLVFVPSASGLSHNEAEYTAPEDLRNGLKFLTAFLHRLAA